MCHELGSISRPTDYEKSILTSRPERCTISRKSATGICRNITPPNPFTHSDKDFKPPYCKCCPSFVRGSGFNLLQGSQSYTVMFPFTSTLRQYGGIRLRVQSRPESPMLKVSKPFDKYPLCREPGSILRHTDYEKSVLTSRPERCAVSRKSATGICRNISIL